jgi:SNF2 family DNA or RNA helicase
VQRFNENYGAPIQKDGDANAVYELRKKIYPFILRRLKKNVLKELPDKTEQILYVEMSDPQRKFYEERRSYYNELVKNMVATKGLVKSQLFIFQALSELRQLASVPEAKTNGTIASPKIEVLIENLMDAIANGHKILVFANFLATIELVSEKLDAAGIDFVTMTGATRNRQKLVDQFQNDKKCKVFLLTLKTGGTGLNLTAADMVFIFDPWWNIAAENQAIDRTHRMGQKNAVTAYKMITQGTIEEKILLLQEKKRELFDNVISSDTAAFKALSEEDIDFMLG